MTPIENATLATKKDVDVVPLLKRLGLSDKELKRTILKLSGGQQQRVAIARSLATDVPIILADEPTGNLDEITAAEITQILQETAHKLNKCVIIVTHSKDVAQKADAVLELKQGILRQVKNEKLIILIICLLLSTFVFSGCVNRTEESESEKVSYDYEISGQEDMSNIEIVPENEK